VLDRMGLTPRGGEPVMDATLRPQLIAALGEVGDPAVRAEARRLFQSPAAIPGSLKSTWLGVIAYDADQATWDKLHQLARTANGSVERTTYYQLLGRTRNEALARRALDLALTPEPGKTVSSGIIAAVAAEHPEMALDFALRHLAQVRSLVDSSGWSRFLAQLGAGSSKPATIAKLDAYAKANVAASDRKPITQVTTRISTRLSENARLKPAALAWLRSHGA
jgi:hypothetical protein